MTWGEAKAIAATAVMRALPRLTEPQATAAVKEAFDDILLELHRSRTIIDPTLLVDSAEIPFEDPYG